MSNSFDVLQKKSRPATPDDSPSIEPKSKKIARLPSYFYPNETNVASNGEFCLIGMVEGESICFQGTALVSCLYGSFSISNYVFKQNDNLWNPKLPNNSPTMTFFPCYSPKSSSLLVIRAKSKPKSKKELSFITNPNSFYSISLSTKPLHPLYSLYKQLIHNNESLKFDTIVVLKSFKTSGINEMESNLPLFKGLFNPTHSKIQNNDFNVPGFFPILDNIISSIPLNYDSSWMNAFKTIQSHSIKSPPIVFVTGQKNTGKSTFSRSLVNQLLSTYSQVAYLETDLGQSEFTPSGFVSLTIIDAPLLGPSFTHLIPSHKSIYMATTTPWKDPDYYLVAILDLAEKYKQTCSHLPLIINTHGWVKGLGMDLLTHLLNAIPYTHIVTLGQSGKENIGSLLPLLSDANPIIIVDSVPDCQSKFNSSDQRTLCTVSYFHQHQSNPTEPLLIKLNDPDSTKIYSKNELKEFLKIWDFNQDIKSILPFCSSLSNLSVCFPYDDVPSSHICQALNATMVGLIQSTNGLPSQLSHLVQPNEIQNSILAIIRCVYKTNDDIVVCFVFPPFMTFESVSLFNGIVRGMIDLPVSFITMNEKGEDLPYTGWDIKQGVGSVCVRPRRNIQRKKNIIQ